MWNETTDLKYLYKNKNKAMLKEECTFMIS